MNRWYTHSTDGQRETITYQPRSEERYWPPDVLQTDSLPAEGVTGRGVVLEGAGAQWMYMHGSAWAMRGGASRVTVVQMPGRREIEIWPRRAGASGKEWFRQVELPSGRVIVWLADAPEGRWDEEILMDVQGGLAGVQGKEVYVTGSGANWMYAGIVVGALRGGAEALWYCSPRLSSDRAIDVANGRMEEMPEDVLGSLRLKTPGIVVGVVGDPCSGKSVFSRVLEKALKAMGKDTWVLDCDGMSLTSPWYLLAAGGAENKDAEVRRREQKVNWTDKLENHVANHLRNVRWFVELAVADLPGGIHKNEQDYHTRIPPHREVMMKEVDLFIVLSREGTTIEEGWRAELAQHGLEGRIVAVFESAAPCGALRCRLRESERLVRGRMEGLDRKNIAGDIPVLPELQSAWQSIEGLM